MYPSISDDRIALTTARAQTPDSALAGWFAALALGIVAQGAPFIVVAAAFDRRGLDPRWLAAIAAVRLLPYPVCSPITGMLAGRYDVRTVFAVAGCGRAAIIAGLSIAIWGEAPPVLVLLLLFSVVAFGTPTFPAIMRVVRHVVVPERREHACTVGSGIESAAFWAGPAFGGLLLLIDRSAVPTAGLIACAAMHVLSVGISSALPVGSTPRHQPDGLTTRQMRCAAQTLLQPGVRHATVAAMGVNVLAGVQAALLVRLPAELDLGGEPAIGWLSTIQGAGSCGAFVAVLWPRARRRHLMALIPLMAAGEAVLLLAVATHLAAALVSCCVIGASIFTAEVRAFSAVGSSAETSAVAPALGLLSAWISAALIGGALIAPPLVMQWGMRPALVIAGLTTPMLAVGAVRALPRSEGVAR